VLDAAWALVREGGYPAATIEAIAARSGVAKTTIYRRWPNRAALLVDLLVQMATAEAPPPSGRDPLRALRTELREVARAADDVTGRLLASLLGEAHHDPAIHAALMRSVFVPRRKATAQVILQAQRSGVLRAGVPPLIAVDLFFGPLFYRRFVRHEPVGEGYVTQVFDHVLEGLAQAGLPTARPGSVRRKGGAGAHRSGARQR